ncbi:MAG: spore coat protein U domain-containing protein [Terracidiphilus sp.]
MRMNPALSVFVIGFLASGPAMRPTPAATATSSFSVTATVLSGCQATPTTQAFRSYAAATTNATSTISVTCTQPTTYVVSLEAGNVSGESATIGKVTGSGSALPGGARPSSPEHPVNRGRKTETGTLADASNCSPHRRAVLERIAASESLAPGVYPNAIMVSITY